MRKKRTTTRPRDTRWIIGGAAAAVLVVGVLIWINLTYAAPSSNALGKCGGPECGQANAPVTIEEYSDFQ